MTDDDTTTHLAVLGLGAMGARMAINHARAGHHVTVWNRTTSVADELAATHGLTATPTPADAATGADAVISMVRDDDAAVSVWLGEAGALGSMRAGSIAIESSTLTPGTARHLAGAAHEAGIRFVEAPVVGSRPQADAGALLSLLGGEPADITAAMPLIEVNASNTVHVGAAGSAAQLKLAINGLLAAQVAAYAEVVGFIERCGLDLEAAMATLAELPITSPGMQRILGLIGRAEFEPNFPIDLVVKDLGYLTETSADVGADVPIMAAARRVFERGASSGNGDLDISGIARSYGR
ncbi:MAG: NAD(P)-dependent oxidoreductase [Actinomycetota bacterium]